MNKEDVQNDYFEWLCDLVCGKRFSKNISFRKLLMFLHNTEFRYSMEMDSNRFKDGVDLRRRYTKLNGIDDRLYLNEPCSVLEMMVALAIRCEENIMDNAAFGDRTQQWFWGMIRSLELNGMTDDNFDKDIAEDIIERFLDRRYKPDGRGGLFTIRNCRRDLRKIEIWIQLLWYLDSIS